MRHISGVVFKVQFCVDQIMCWGSGSVEAHPSACGAGGL